LFVFVLGVWLVEGNANPEAVYNLYLIKNNYFIKFIS